MLAGPRPPSPGTSPSEAPCFWNLHTCFPWSAGGCFFPLQLPEASLTPSEGHPQSNPKTSESVASNLWGAGKQDSPDFCVWRTNSRAPWDGGPQLECRDLVTCGGSEAIFSCGFPILETTCYLGGTSFSCGLRGQDMKGVGGSLLLRNKGWRNTLTPNPTIVRATQGTENVALGLNSSLENSLLTHLAKESNKCHPKVTLCYPL